LQSFRGGYRSIGVNSQQDDRRARFGNVSRGGETDSARSARNERYT
jgi:hypothetical protein